MKAMTECNFMQGAKIGDEDFFRGEAIIWIDWEEVYQLYHQDALDISMTALWLLMEIQTCRKKGYYHIGFVDPQVVNCKNLLSNHAETFKNL